MRILVTKAGKSNLSVLKSEDKESKNSKENAMKTQARFILSEKSKMTKSVSSKQQTYSRNRSKIVNTFENGHPLHSQKISIKQKKINIPKNISEKYNNDYTNNIILPELPENLSKKIDNSNLLTSNNSHDNDTSALYFNSFFCLKDILQPDVISKMKKTMEYNRVMKAKNSSVSDNSFRSNMKKVNYLKDIEEKLEKTIHVNRINLIKYLSSKKSMNEWLIKKIANYDEEKLNKMNKICQIVFYNEDKNKLYGQIMKDKIQAINLNDKALFKNKIQEMGGYVKGIKKLSDQYKNRSNKLEKYIDLHTEMKKNYWDKFNRLCSSDKSRSNPLGQSELELANIN